MRSSVEDYIKQIYTLQVSSIKVSTRNLAELLNISMPSVSEMIKKLTESGFITSKPYRGFKLTSKGEKLAILQIRKHRLLEHFMKNVLNYEWEEVHAEAEKLEHAVSEKFINRLEDYMDFPKYDPHGHPIPDINGKIQNLNSHPLSVAVKEKSYIVSNVNDRSEEILKYLKEIDLNINSKIRIAGVLEFDGSVFVEVRGMKYLLSKKIADSIFVIQGADKKINIKQESSNG
jgi:DtxR family transcriptional regulator, Mn-dependent transcriptional regulator